MTSNKKETETKESKKVPPHVIPAKNLNLNINKPHLELSINLQKNTGDK